MELVKRVDVHVDAITGKLIFTENPEGNAAIYRTKVTKENFKTISKFCEFFQMGCPSNFTVSHFIMGEGAEINLISHQGDYRICISVHINKDKGIFGHYHLQHYNTRWAKGEYQIFYYHWGSDINSMKLFQNVFEKIEFFATDETAINILKKLYPEAESIYNREEYFTLDQYIVKYGREFVFQYYPKDKSVKLLGYLVENEYRYYLRTIDDLEDKIEQAKLGIEDILAMQEMMDESVNSVKPKIINRTELAAKREQAKLDQNKADLPRLRAMPRDPQLMAMNTHQLLSILEQLRKNPGGYDSYYGQFDKDKIKAELLYRPHYPKGKAGKEHRRNLAQGKTQVPKGYSRNFRKQMKNQNGE